MPSAGVMGLTMHKSPQRMLVVRLRILLSLVVISVSLSPAALPSFLNENPS